MKYKSFLLLFSSLLFSVFNFAQKKEIQIVLLGGQSNMEGHGNYDALDTASLLRVQKASEKVLLATRDLKKKEPVPLTGYNGWKSKKYNFSKHFGPELFSGAVLSEKYPEKDFLLIKTAVGGTSLYGAWNPNWTKEKAMVAEKGEQRQKMQLYKSHLKNIKSNLAALDAKGIPYRIIGMLWLQGESDTGSEVKAKSYQDNLEKLINSYRQEFEIENMPFILGQINILPKKFKEGPAIVRKAMQSVADIDENVSIINTTSELPWDDYPKHSDNVHYNTEGQKRLGIAFAKALIEFMK